MRPLLRRPWIRERQRPCFLLRTSGMCGRYSLGKKPRSWPKDGEDFQPRYNIAPSQDAPVFLNDGSLMVRQMRWGLIPSWADDEKISSKMINAKAETLSKKPAFRRCLENRRCVVPADGFYEWRTIGRTKIPRRFILEGDQPFEFAALWDSWPAPGRNRIESFTIITTDANEVVRPIHDRMPVILDSSAIAEWLDPDRPFESLEPLLRPYSGRLMRHHLVSSRVNDARFEDASCIEPMPDLQSMLPGI
jgi:putative SOS response-associated peptidase YedK